MAGYHKYDADKPHSIECRHDDDNQNSAHEKKEYIRDMTTMTLKCATEVINLTEQTQF